MYGHDSYCHSSHKYKVIAIVGLNDPVLVSASPDKANIFYTVRENTSLSVKVAFTPIVAKLRTLRRKMPRVMVFCRQYEDCACIYDFFVSSLKEEFTEPIAAPNLARFRLVDMYTGVTRKTVQDAIITAFCTGDSPLRIVICTVAFGMGLDCVNVSQIIHWGPASDVDSYMQECGRAGRNGEPVTALLYWKKKDFKSNTISKKMKVYCSNQGTCRRTILASYFDCTKLNVNGCNCCDVCAINCTCNSCNV